VALDVLKEVFALKIRIKYSKHGNTRFVGHLDMMRYFQKAMRRAGIPIKYSEGFSPHQIMSFAAPLGIGMESEAEYIDIEVTEALDRVKAIEMLNNAMCEGVTILDWKEMPEEAKTAMSKVYSADFLVLCDPDKVDLNKLAHHKLLIPKENKKGELKETDIKPWLYEIHKTDNGIFMHVAQGSAGNLNPKALMWLLGIENYRIIKKEVYDVNGLTL